MGNDKTRITRAIHRRLEIVQTQNDCVVVIYTTQPTLLGKRFQLSAGRMSFGRDSESDVLLHDDSISRRHSRLERRVDGWYIVDQDSTNGCYVNEDLIEGECLLANNDRIQLGSTILKYLSGADAEAQYHEEIYRISILDGLTQIYNKRYMFEMLEREVTRARRHDRPVSVILFDIDHFKRCNDVYGHLAGDSILRALAKLVQERVRREELFARYGGEEFAVVLPEATLEDTVKLAEILRERIEQHVFELQDTEIRITISAGCAQLDPEDDTAVDLVHRADKKLYEAKGAGRNTVRS